MELEKTNRWVSKTNISLIISGAALIISYCSYRNSSNSLRYEMQKELAEKSPSLLLETESDRVNFTLDKESARLQTVLLKFPDKISLRYIVTEGERQNVTLSQLEEVASDFFCDRIIALPSVPQIKIPVVIDFEAVVERKTIVFREDHFMVFNIVSIDSSGRKVLKYHGSRFNYGLVCPQEYNKTTREDLKQYLDARFDRSLSYYKQEGIIR